MLLQEDYLADVHVRLKQLGKNGRSYLQLHVRAVEARSCKELLEDAIKENILCLQRMLTICDSIYYMLYVLNKLRHVGCSILVFIG